MIKNRLKTLRCSIAGVAVAAALVLPHVASAEVLFSETFDYPEGNLYSQGGWLQSNNTLNPVQVTGTTLSYNNFMKGKSVALKSNSTQDQDVIHACVERDATSGAVTPVTQGDVYVAFLINVQNVESKNYFFSLVSSTSGGAISDGKAPIGNLGRVIANPSDTEGKFRLGFDKSSNNPTAESGDLDLGVTHLVVLRYSIVEGSTNDIFEAWVNPTATQTTANYKTDSSKADLSRGVAGIMISQATGSTLKTPEMLVGPIKVATTWAELFEEGASEGPGGPEKPVEGGELTVAMTPLPEYFALYQYQEYPVEITVKGSDLTGDIAIGGLGETLKSEVSTISAADAMSAAGYKFTATMCSTDGNPIDQTLTFTSGTAEASVPVKADVQGVKTLLNFRATSGLVEWDEVYYYSGNARVTYVEAGKDEYDLGKIYLQDVVGGIGVGFNYTGLETSPFKEGDKIKNIYLMKTEDLLGVPQFELLSYFAPEGMGCGTLVASDDFATPAEISLADLVASPESYINRLVKVSDLTFSTAGEKFTTAGTPVTSGEAAGRVRPFAGTDVIGTEIPAEATVTGISTSLDAAVVSVRRAADIETPAELPSIEISRELLVDATEYYPVNVATPFAKLTVKAVNMPKATSVWIGGKNRAAFIADVDEIPAGTGEYTVNISFKPTTVGRNEAMINFDASPTELSKSMSFACLAFDPDNMPEISVDSSNLKPFEAAAGATQEQTVTIHAARLLDYGSVRVLGQGQGAFRINTTSFLKEGDTQIKITFAPLTDGTYTEVIEFSTPKAETLTVTVTGTAGGKLPEEERQGDELSFDTSAPKAQYSTDFSGIGDNNKPMSLEGWKNVALDGTRAYWSYTTDGNTMAKVTAYDSRADESSEAPAEMLLLSPALDFVKSPSRLLTFRVMGEFLTDNMTDEFNVLYIDPTLPETDRYQVIAGIDIPANADASGEWREFIVDLDGLEIADTFFIGFHFKSTRGRNNTAVYYVDDFSWGDPTVPFIRVDIKQATGTAKVGETKPIEEFTVTGMNLTGAIALGLEGADKEHFELSTDNLPAEGGKFTASYKPQEIGDHAVYVTLNSDGAPATYLIVGGKASEYSGIDGIEAADGSRVEYYNLQGHRIYKPEAGQIYIRVLDGKASKIVK